MHPGFEYICLRLVQPIPSPAAAVYAFGKSATDISRQRSASSDGISCFSPKKKTADTINRRFLCGILVSAGLSMSGRLASELFSGVGAIPSGFSVNRGHLLFRILSALYHPSHVCLNRHFFDFFPVRLFDPQTQTSVRSSDCLADGNVMNQCSDQFSSGRGLRHLVPPPQ